MKTVYAPGIALLLGAFALSGCETTAGPGAPPITAATLAAGARQQADPAMLTSGRSLYIGRCARCHALPAVAEHSAEQWPEIVSHMAKRSGLNAQQSRAVLAYVLAARQE